MDPIVEDILLLKWHGRVWQWFAGHAQGKRVLPLLALIAFADAIISPLAAEVYLAALMVANPRRWKWYLAVAVSFSTLGAAVGYFFAKYLFAQFGMSILHFYGLERQFVDAQHVLRGHVFTTVGIGSFLPLPDKVFIYAAGFLSVHFLPYIAGYFLGRGARMTVVVYLSERYGKHVVDLLAEYARWFVLALLAILALYGIVHLHLLG